MSDAAMLISLLRAQWRVPGLPDDALAGLFVAIRPLGAPAYTLGIVDGAGYLQAVEDGSNPWWDIDADADGPTPHALPVTLAQTYETVYVRHPSPDFARGLTAALNGGDAMARIESEHGPIAPARHTVTPSLHDGRCVATVAEAAEAFYPMGHAACGGWLVYPQMPLADLTAVQDAVRALRAQLGALGYPVGIQEAPYLPSTLPKFTKPMGHFDLSLASVLRAFQDDAERGEHFVRTRPGSLKDGAWMGLWGHASRGPGEGPFEPALADRATVSALLRWHDQAWRKPGPLLLGIPTGTGVRGDRIWMREEVAVRVTLWRTLAAVFGVETGIKSGHAFRAIGGMKSGGGVALMSLHKTGLAIDVAVTSDPGDDGALPYTRPAAHWHITFEAEARPVGRIVDDAAIAALQGAQTEAEAATSAARERLTNAPAGPARQKATAQLRRAEATERAAARALADGEYRRRTGLEPKRLWLLYGPTRLDALGRDSAEAHATLRARLARLCEDYDQELTASAGPLDSPLPSAIEAGRALAMQLRDHYLRALDEDASAFCDSLFRIKVRRWAYDPFSPHAGAPGGYARPTEVEPGARAFVNLTRLGEAVELARIAATSDARGDSEFAQRNTTLGLTDNKSARGAVALLKKLRDRGEREATVEVLRKRFRFERVLSGLDLDALGVWLSHLAQIEKRSERARQSARVRPAVTQVSWVFAADTDDFQRHARPTLDVLRGRLACAHFAVVSVGDALSPEAQAAQDQVLTGAALADLVDATQRAFAEHTAALHSAAERIRRASIGKAAPRWSLTVQLVAETPPPRVAGTAAFVAFAPGDQVRFAARGSGQALEWWHFQLHRAVIGARSWAQAAREIGYHGDPLFAWHDGTSAALKRCPNSLTLPLPRDVPRGFNQRRQGYIDRKDKDGRGLDVMSQGYPAGNGEALHRRLFFVLFYNNPGNDADGAFLRAALTCVDAMKRAHGYDPAVDQMLVRPASTEAAFVQAWRAIGRACEGARARVYEGRVLFHASVRGDATGIEFRDGTLEQHEIEGLPRLPWGPGARLHIVGCNTGLGGDEIAPGWSTPRAWIPAQAFADAQLVKTLGEAGFAYFSQDPERYVANDGRCPTLHLAAFRRRRNLGVSGAVLADGDGAPRIPARLFLPGG